MKKLMIFMLAVSFCGVSFGLSDVCAPKETDEQKAQFEKFKEAVAAEATALRRLSNGTAWDSEFVYKCRVEAEKKRMTIGQWLQNQMKQKEKLQQTLNVYEYRIAQLESNQLKLYGLGAANVLTLYVIRKIFLPNTKILRSLWRGMGK